MRRRTTISHVECNVCREALSARIDGEREPVASEQVDAHLEVCPAWRRRQAVGIGVTRRLRMHAIVDSPDLTASIMSRLDEVESTQRPKAYYPSLLRVLLAMVGVLQCGIGAAQVTGVEFGMAGMTGPMPHESTAWQLAIGIGLFYCAVRVYAVVGMAVILAAFLLVMCGFAMHDLAVDMVNVGWVVSYPVAVVGLVLLLLIRRSRQCSPGLGGVLRVPIPEAAEEPLPLPAGARYGRRTGHLQRVDHGPAA